jgi:hypothetical protein
MKLAKFQPEAFPNPRDSADLALESSVSARLAADHDAFVASPVHRLQSELSAFATGGEIAEMPVVEHYPGWFRLGFPVAASGLLWFMILRVVGVVG